MKIISRIFAAGILTATLSATALSASACEGCMKGAKPISAKSAAPKSKAKIAKMTAKTAANAKMSPKKNKVVAAKMTSVQASAKKTAASVPACSSCQHGAVKENI